MQQGKHQTDYSMCIWSLSIVLLCMLLKQLAVKVTATCIPWHTGCLCKDILCYHWYSLCTLVPAARFYCHVLLLQVEHTSR